MVNRTSDYPRAVDTTAQAQRIGIPSTTREAGSLGQAGLDFIFECSMIVRIHSKRVGMLVVP
jgi:hypothetical protein